MPPDPHTPGAAAHGPGAVARAVGWSAIACFRPSAVSGGSMSSGRLRSPKLTAARARQLEHAVWAGWLALAAQQL